MKRKKKIERAKQNLFNAVEHNYSNSKALLNDFIFCKAHFLTSFCFNEQYKIQCCQKKTNFWTEQQWCLKKKKLSKKPLKKQKLTQTLQTNYSFMTLVAPSNKYNHWHKKGSSDCSLPLRHRTSPPPPPTWQELCHGKELIVKHIDPLQVLLCWQGEAQRLRDDLGSHVPLHAHAADLHVPSVLLAELRRELLGGKAV